MNGHSTGHLTIRLRIIQITSTIRWRFGLLGNVVGRINEVNRRRARLVFGWVNVGRWVNHLGM